MFKLRIKIEWWKNVKRGRLVLERHKNELQEVALNHITEQRKDGYICGQLMAQIDGIDYLGWWEVKE